MRSLIVHFAGGTEITIQTAMEPTVVYGALIGDGEWLIIEDSFGERHYLSVRNVAYLTFSTRKGIGFA
ncbi:MAG TPA: hypothetical protein VFD74_07545 [Thermoleophilia bacterium]|nr:hypothetical protein [Thermoleophilia bacterium]